MAFPTLEVSVSFTTGPYDTPVWVDITAYVNQVKIKTGRTRELQGFDVGTLELELDNFDRRFDPFEATGPYYGNLKPNKQVRVRATWAAVTYDMWYGYMDGWPVSYRPGETMTMRVTASDAFKLLAGMRLDDSFYEREVLADNPLLFAPMSETRGTSWQDRSPNGRDSVGTGARPAATERGLPLRIGGGQPVLNRSLNSGVRAFFPASAETSGQLTVECWFRGDPYTSSGGDRVSTKIYMGGGMWIELGSNGLPDGSGSPIGDVCVLLFNYVGPLGTAVAYYRTNGTNWYDSRVHHLVVCHNPGGASEIYVDGVSQPLVSAGPATNYLASSVGFATGQIASNATTGSSTAESLVYQSDLATYSGLLSAARVAAHYEAGTAPWSGDLTSARVTKTLALTAWPVARQNISTGLNTCGPLDLDSRSVLEILRAAESSEGGQLYVDHRDGGKVRFEHHQERITATRSNTVQYTFSDDPTAGGVYRYDDLDVAYDEQDLVNEVTVEYTGGQRKASDVTSQTDFGLRSLTVKTELSTGTAADSLGGWIVGRYASPHIRCKAIEVVPASITTDHFLPVLGARISDRVNARRLPRHATTAFDSDLIIEGIEHEITKGVSSWRTWFRCSDVDATDYWRLGTSGLGTSTRLAY